MATQAQSHNFMWCAALVLAVLAVWALVLNAPPPSIGAHAEIRHGTDAQRIMDEWQRGACTEVWRHTATNRVIRIVSIGDKGGGIVTTLAGKPVTAYMASLPYWGKRVVGWELVTREGDCG